MFFTLLASLVVVGYVIKLHQLVYTFGFDASGGLLEFNSDIFLVTNLLWFLLPIYLFVQRKVSTDTRLNTLYFTSLPLFILSTLSLLGLLSPFFLFFRMTSM